MADKLPTCTCGASRFEPGIMDWSCRLPCIDPGRKAEDAEVIVEFCPKCGDKLGLTEDGEATCEPANARAERFQRAFTKDRVKQMYIEAKPADDNYWVGYSPKSEAWCGICRVDLRLGVRGGEVVIKDVSEEALATLLYEVQQALRLIREGPEIDDYDMK